jgi:hypothetical protein
MSEELDANLLHPVQLGAQIGIAGTGAPAACFRQETRDQKGSVQKNPTWMLTTFTYA